MVLCPYCKKQHVRRLLSNINRPNGDKVYKARCNDCHKEFWVDAKTDIPLPNYHL